MNRTAKNTASARIATTTGTNATLQARNDTVYRNPSSARLTPKSARPAAKIQYADDGIYDIMTALGDISVELELASLPLQSQAILLGHTYANGVITMADTDIPPYLAIGFMSRATNGKYRFVWLFKGKFSLSDTEYSTITDKPTFKSQTIKGTFMKRDYDGNWQSVADSGDIGFVQATADNWFTSVGGISPGVADITVSAGAVSGGKNTLTINGLRHGDYAYMKGNATSQTKPASVAAFNGSTYTQLDTRDFTGTGDTISVSGTVGQFISVVRVVGGMVIGWGQSGALTA